MPDGRSVPGDETPSWLGRRSLMRLLMLPIGGGLLGLLIALVVPSRYTATASFFPETKDVGRDLGAFAGIASQLGFGLAGSGQSAQFYVQVLSSRALLDEALQSKVTLHDGTGTTLLDFLVRASSDSAWRHDKALTRLGSGVRATVNPRTNIVDLEVTLKDPNVSAQVASQLLASLNRFNIDVRRSQSGERRRFLQSRLADGQDSLRIAEEGLRSFLENNRTYRGSPALEVQLDQLQRKVTTYQTLLTGLRRDYESARLDAVNDTPVFTVIDTPVVPSKRSSPSRIAALVSGFLLGLVILALIVSGRTWLWRLRTDDPAQYASFMRMAAAFRRGS